MVPTFVIVTMVAGVCIVTIACSLPSTRRFNLNRNTHLKALVCTYLKYVRVERVYLPDTCKGAQVPRQHQLRTDGLGRAREVFKISIISEMRRGHALAWVVQLRDEYPATPTIIGPCVLHPSRPRRLHMHLMGYHHRNEDQGCVTEGHMDQASTKSQFLRRRRTRGNMPVPPLFQSPHAATKANWVTAIYLYIKMRI